MASFRAKSCCYPSPNAALLAASAVAPTSVTALAPPVPSLRREASQNYTYVDGLVDAAVLIVRCLWGKHETRQGNHMCDAARSSEILRHFITETSRKSKTSLSTMQLALMYCIKLRRKQDIAFASIGQTPGSTCGRKNFLVSLILASKYLQDRNFSNRAWSRISLLDVRDINLLERDFLSLVDWNLNIACDKFRRWTDVVNAFTVELREATMFGSLEACYDRLKMLVEKCVAITEPQIEASMAVKRLDQRTAVEVLEEIDTALLTPAATPKETSPQESVLDVDASAPAESKTTDVAATAAAEPASPSSLFDEFIKATPLVQTDDAACSFSYLTPASLRTETPRTDDSAAASPNDALRQSSFTSAMSLDLMLCTAPGSRKRGHSSSASPSSSSSSSFDSVPSTPTLATTTTNLHVYDPEIAHSMHELPPCKRQRL
ncbi:PHO85 cyclin-5 [Savitreella phatthalungensis]